MTAQAKPSDEETKTTKKEKSELSKNDSLKQPVEPAGAGKQTEPPTGAGETSKQKNEPSDSSTPSLYLKVYSPYRVYYEGRVSSVSAENATGPFDILPKHHNFITLLLPCDMIVRAENECHRIRIQGGMMHIKYDEVIVFLDV